MIKVTCAKGKINATLDGSVITIMSELSVIVDSVCASVAEEIDSSDGCKNMLITKLAETLLAMVKLDEKSNK